MGVADEEVRRAAWALVEAELRAAEVSYVEILYESLGDKTTGVFVCLEDDTKGYFSKNFPTLLEAMDSVKEFLDKG